MENKNLEIQTVEAKKSQAGKTYWRVKTNEGWASCFLKKTADLLQENMGSVCEVKATTTQNGEYQNTVIRAFIKVSEGDVTQVSEEIVNNDGLNHHGEKVKSQPTRVNNNKKQSMYTSYAKDLFLGMYGFEASEGTDNPEGKSVDKAKLMNECIALIKQAKEEFK